MQTKDIIKIAIVGPESTGKSTLSKLLAAHYNTAWVPEFAREYCQNLQQACTMEDEVNMFHGQLQLEKQIEPQANRLLICDTTILTVKIWSDYMLGQTAPEVLAELVGHTYDLYLLLDIDIPWEDDPLRDFPHLREYFLGIWEKELQALGAYYKLIGGNYPERLNSSIKEIDLFLAKCKDA